MEGEEITTLSEKIRSIYAAHHDDVIKFIDSMNALQSELKNHVRYLAEDFCELGYFKQDDPAVSYCLEDFAWLMSPHTRLLQRAVDELDRLYHLARNSQISMAWIIEQRKEQGKNELTA